MKPLRIFIIIIVLFGGTINLLKAQEDETENKLKVSGSVSTDQRFLMQKGYDWAWNRNSIGFNFGKKFTGRTKFHSSLWIKNNGLAHISNVPDLYRKGAIDPLVVELYEAYVQINDFLVKNLDIKLGRQRIAWGTADKLNPTDNLNAYDLLDVLNFGKHRGSDAINLTYYFNSDFKVQGVYIPLFKPANLPVGIFSDILMEEPVLPDSMLLKTFTNQINMPRYNLAKSSVFGLKFKGFAAGFDFSLSYVFGRDGLPVPKYNTFTPLDTMGGTALHSELSYFRTHILGADLAGNIAGAGVWAEAALFLPDEDVRMTNDLSAFYPDAPIPVKVSSTFLKKKPYLKFVLGTDYIFSDGSYFNFQYLHGFMHERGLEELNDYFFMRYEKKFFDERLIFIPLGGGFIVTDWKDIKNNHAFIYMPEIAYMATDNAKITLSTAIFSGKGENMFVKLKDFNMFMLKFKYNF